MKSSALAIGMFKVSECFSDNEAESVSGIQQGAEAAVLRGVLRFIEEKREAAGRVYVQVASCEERYIEGQLLAYSIAATHIQKHIKELEAAGAT